MITLRILQPGQPERVARFDGDQVVIGRAADAQLRIVDDYISSRHARVMVGLIVEDLNSTNGSFVDGECFRGELRVAPGGRFALGSEEIVLELQEGDDDDLLDDIDATVPYGMNVSVDSKGSGESGGRATMKGSADGDPALRQDNSRLQAEVSRLQADIARLGDDKGTLEVRLDQAERALEASAGTGGAAPQGAPETDVRGGVELERLQGRVDQLERSEIALTEELERARAEAEEARAGAAKPAPAASDLFTSLNREVARLKAENAELAAKAAAGGGEAPPTAVPTSVGGATGTGDLELRLERLQTERDQLRKDLQAARQGAAGAARSGGADWHALVRTLIDTRGREPEADGSQPMEEFLFAEQFRFLLKSEKVVSRMASSLVQLLNANTIVPGADLNWCGHLEEVLANPGDANALLEAGEYAGDLNKWLVASIASYKKASLRFVDQLRVDLSEQGLTRDNPIPSFKKLYGQAEAVLWKRSKGYVSGLTAEIAEERLEALARDSAQIFLSSDSEFD